MSGEPGARSIGFGVVGLGMGWGHCRAILETQGARLVGVCDLDRALLARASADFACKAYGRFEEMLADPAVEVVSIATPNGTHASLGIQAAQAGKHLVVEKPLDVSLPAIDSLIDATDRAGVKLAGVFQSRFHPLMREIERAVAGGRLGRTYGIHGDLFWWRDDTYFSAALGRRRADWGLDGGGALATQGVHTLDLLQWLGGPVASVFGYMGRFAQAIEAEDKLSCLLRFTSGAIASLNVTTVAWPGGGDTITIHGEGGTIATGKDRWTLDVWKLRDDTSGEDERRMLARFGPAAQGEPGGNALHAEVFADMVQAIREDRAPAIDGRLARVPVELMLAIYESCRTGTEVRLPLAGPRSL
ncbi:MAG: Gfo/Idh/MocA family protein [Anaerolineae bacterium]